MNTENSFMKNINMHSLQKLIILRNAINQSLSKFHSDGETEGVNCRKLQADTTVINNKLKDQCDEMKKTTLDVGGVEVHDNHSVIYIPNENNDVLDTEDTEVELIPTTNDNNNKKEPSSGLTPVLKRKHLTDKSHNQIKKFKPLFATVIDLDNRDDDATKAPNLKYIAVSPIITNVVDDVKKTLPNLEKANVIIASLLENLGLQRHKNCLCHQYIKDLAELAEMFNGIVNASQEFFNSKKNDEDNGDKNIVGQSYSNNQNEKTSKSKNERSISADKPDDKETNKNLAKKVNIINNISIAKAAGENASKGKKTEETKKTASATKSDNANKTNKHSSGNATKPSTSSSNPTSTRNTGSFPYDNIYCDQKLSFRGLRPIVVDGSSIAMAHGRGRFSVRGLRICIDFFLRRGHSVYAFIPQYRLKRNKSDNQRALINLVERQLVFCTSSCEIEGRRYTSYEDRITLQVAGMMKAVLVSCDTYKNLIAEDPSFSKVLKDGLLKPTFVGNWFSIPQYPFGRNGPHINDFLDFSRNR